MHHYHCSPPPFLKMHSCRQFNWLLISTSWLIVWARMCNSCNKHLPGLFYPLMTFMSLCARTHLYGQLLGSSLLDNWLIFLNFYCVQYTKSGQFHGQAPRYSFTDVGRGIEAGGCSWVFCLACISIFSQSWGHLHLVGCCTTENWMTIFFCVV